MRSSLERADTLINLRNQEIAALNSRLAAKEAQITELGEQLDRAESEAKELRLQLEVVIAGNQALRATQATTELELPEPADFFNGWKAKHPKSKLSFAEMRAILEMIVEYLTHPRD